VTGAARFLAKRLVHDVGATRTDWTRRPTRGTTPGIGSIRRCIEAVTEGLEGSAPGPHLVRGRRSLGEDRVRAQAFDRLTHHAEIIAIEGESYRKRDAERAQKSKR
jgi:hypothetical protein